LDTNWEWARWLWEEENTYHKVCFFFKIDFKFENDFEYGLFAGIKNAPYPGGPGDIFVAKALLSAPTVSREQKASIWEEATLFVSPNPFRNIATITFSAPEKAKSIRIFDITGKMVASINDVKGTSTHWSPRGLPTGVYVVNMIANGKKYSKKVILQ